MEIKYLYMISMAIAGAIALLCPVDILAFDSVRAFVGYVGAAVPMVKKLNGAYELAGVAQFFFSVMWLLSPLTYMSSAYLINAEKFVEGARKHRILIGVICAVVIPIMIITIYIVGFDTSDHDGRGFIVANSRIGMMTYGWAIVNGCAIALRMSLLWKSRLWEIYS